MTSSSDDAAAPSSSTPEEGIKDGSKSSTLSILKELRVGSKGFLDFYPKVLGSNHGRQTRRKPSYGILDNPLRFILRVLIVIVGFIFLNDCQAEPMLPIFLIVNGVGGLSIQIIDEIAGSSLLKNDNTTWKRFKDLYFTIMGNLLFWWFIAARCVWVYRMPLPSMNAHLPAPEKYCAFPIYGLSVFRVLSLYVEVGGYLVIVTVTAVVLYFPLPEIENNVRNMDGIANDEKKKT